MAGPNEIDEERAIKSLADELGNSNAVLAFKPKDVQARFFLGAALLALAGIFFVSAFFRGLRTSLEDRAERLGESTGNWLSDKLGALLRRPEVTPSDKSNADREMREMASWLATHDDRIVNSSADEVERSIVDLLEKRGMTRADATKIAKKTREVATPLIAWERAHGAKRG